MGKEKETGFYKQNNWILWKKPDGKIGVSPDRGDADKEKEIVMKVQGDFDKACRYAEDIENGVATQLSIFDFLPPEEPEDKKGKKK